MNIIDISLLVALGGFVLAGFWFGFVHMVGGIVGLILGAILAGQFEGVLAAKIIGWVGGNANLAHVLAFIFIFGIATRLVGVAFWVVEKIFGIFHFIPLLKTFDRLLGAALGLLEGTIAIGLMVYFAARFPITLGFGSLLASSQFAPQFQSVGAILAPLLPLAIRVLKSVI